MENSNGIPKLSFKDVNEMDIVDYLASRNIHPAMPERNGKCWFHSPIREGDSKPSFVVWRRSNTWYDFGLGRGTTLVDLGMELYRCSAHEFLEKMNGPSQAVIPKAKLSKAEAEAKVQILEVGPFSHSGLIDYIRSRKIPLGIVRQHASQVRFKIYAEQVAIGFRNDQNGYELRNAYGKISSLPKDSTFIDNRSGILDVLEGQFDFYSRFAMLRLQKQTLPNFLILNGTGFFNQKLPLMCQHDLVRLFLDQGKGAREFTANALRLDKHKFTDESAFYRRHDDLNDWWKFEGHKVFPEKPPNEILIRSQGLHR